MTDSRREPAAAELEDATLIEMGREIFVQEAGNCERVVANHFGGQAGSRAACEQPVGRVDLC